MTQLVGMSLKELSENLLQGRASATEVLDSHLAHIASTDPKIGAFLHIETKAASRRASELDSLPAKSRGPLHGVPIAVKDIISVAAMPCTCGSRVLEGYRPLFNATVVRRLLDAGAVILGKTNMDEFAMGSSNENSAYHPTRNPWNLDYVPGGSSGGSAAAVASLEVPLALGTDTGGSIRQPASLCGIVGLKPTYGRVSRYGLVAFASSLDQIGPMTRSVEDAALALSLLAGDDPLDATCSTEPVPVFSGDRKSAGKLTIGVPVQAREGLDRDVTTCLDAAVEQFNASGVDVRSVSIPAMEHAIACYYILATAEASSNLARFDGVRYGRRTEADTTLNEMIAKSREEGLGAEVKRRILLGTYVLSAGYADRYYQTAQRVRTLIRQDYDSALEEVDAVLMPTSPTPAFRLGQKSDDPLQMYLSDIFTITANLTGSPAMSLPAGFSEESLPIGIQLVGKHNDELTLLQLGSLFQSATTHHLEKPAWLSEPKERD